MKKIKNLLIILLLIFGFVSCKPSNKVSPSDTTTPISQTSSEMSYKVSLSHLKCSVPNEIKRKQQFKANSLDYQYLVVDINNDEIILSIYLNNEKDYHIFDFELECNDENAKVFIDNEFKLINSLSFFSSIFSQVFVINSNNKLNVFISTITFIGGVLLE